MQYILMLGKVTCWVCTEAQAKAQVASAGIWVRIVRQKHRFQICFRPGSNRGPCACEAHVITTTLRKLCTKQAGAQESYRAWCHRKLVLKGMEQPSCGPVAQWITRLPTEQKIVGSSPAWIDKLFFPQKQIVFHSNRYFLHLMCESEKMLR